MFVFTFLIHFSADYTLRAIAVFLTEYAVRLRTLFPRERVNINDNFLGITGANLELPFGYPSLKP